MRYRKEIDGLRAVAVLPVLLFHAGFESFSGGFVGVDVFFVISGYLITSIILAECAVGRFSIVNFYERRARRILPALFLVMLACLPFAWRWMPPVELREFSDSLVAVSLFVSNMLFMRESGYFATAAELKPLLHTWSLAVEEQYYVLFPLFVALTWRFGRRFLAGALAVGLVVSLLWAQAGGNLNPRPPFVDDVWDWWDGPSWGFYFAVARAWELNIGGLIAVYHHSRGERTLSPAAGRRLGQSLSLLGLALILLAVFSFDESTPFPSIWTLIPTVGTGLIILFASPHTLVGSALGHKWPVLVGLISYSTYLWHQPLLAFARLRSPNEPSLILMAVLLLASIVLAYFTWRLVEVPFRDRSRFSRRTIFAAGFAMSLAMIAVGVAGHVGNGFPGRIPATVLAAIEPAKTREAEACRWQPVVPDLPAVRACEFGDPAGAQTVALYGDSHAQALFSAMDRALRERGLRGLRVDNALCHAVPGIRDSRVKVRPEDCRRGHAAVLQYLQREAESVVVSIRWTYRLFPVPGEIESLTFDNGEGGIESDAYRENYTEQDGRRTTAAEGKRIAIRQLVESLLGTGLRVVVIYPVPEVGWDVPKLNFKRWLATGEIPPVVSTDAAAYRNRNAFVESALDAVGAHDRLHVVRPATLLCGAQQPGRCIAQADGVPLYFDDNHLSDVGAALIISEVMDVVTGPAASSH